MRRVTLALACVILSGCTHIALRNHTLQQSRTVTDLQYQQVLDNLAMFSVNPDAMPFFSIPSNGATAVDTTADVTNTTAWGPLGFLQNGLSFKATRKNGGSWTLAPINDPAKLTRMRCAYQIAVGYHLADDQNACLQCCALIKAWYPNGNNDECGRPCRVPPPGWYCVGGKSDVPKHACYVGRYCDTYVWVVPGGVEQLTLLTLTVLDFATATSGFTPPAPTQEVTRKWKPSFNKKTGVLEGFTLEEVTTKSLETRHPLGVPAGELSADQIEAMAQAAKAAGADAALESAAAAGIHPSAKLQETQRVPPATQKVPHPVPVNPFDRPRENFFNPVLPLLPLMGTQ